MDAQPTWDGKISMPWIYDDGGRKASGFVGHVDDCVCRSISIATGMPYRDIYDQLNELGKREYKTKGRRRSSARRGVRRVTYDRLLRDLGWTWVPTRAFAKPPSVYLCHDDLPPGRLIVRVSKHMTCVVDHVIRDTFDPQRITQIVEDGVTRHARRTVYGYYVQGGA